MHLCDALRQLPSQARSMSGLDPGRRAGHEEALNALVPEAPDHSESVAPRAASAAPQSLPLLGFGLASIGVARRKRA